MVDLSASQALLSGLSGAIVGFTLGLLGGGGSILAVPLLLYWVGYPDPHVVIGTTALAVSANAYLNLIPHARAGHVRWHAAITFALPGALAAMGGAWLGKKIDGSHLLFLFALLMLVVAYFMVRPRRQQITRTKLRTPLIENFALLGAGTGAGLLSGFFGIGGGFLIVPGLMLASRMTVLNAIGSSLFSVGTFGLSTAFSYAWSGLLDWRVAGLFILGGIFGGRVGVYMSTRLGQYKNSLNWVFAAMVSLTAIYMLYRNLAG